MHFHIQYCLQNMPPAVHFEFHVDINDISEEVFLIIESKMIIHGRRASRTIISKSWINYHPSKNKRRGN